jgi:hypothetical protein
MIGVRRAIVDLAKDRNGVAGVGTKHEGSLILDGRLECQFRTRKYFAQCADYSRTYQGPPHLEAPHGCNVNRKDTATHHALGGGGSVVVHASVW